jgi:hypothetical protein
MLSQMIKDNFYFKDKRLSQFNIKTHQLRRITENNRCNQWITNVFLQKNQRNSVMKLESDFFITTIRSDSTNLTCNAQKEKADNSSTKSKLIRAYCTKTNMKKNNLENIPWKIRSYLYWRIEHSQRI